MAPAALDRIPGGYQMLALAIRARGGLLAPWRALAPWRLGARAEGFTARPRDLRPADPDRGQSILAGAFSFAGETAAHGPRGDPWDRASPSRRFAAALHGFGWLDDLLALDEPGVEEALRLTLAWRRVFARDPRTFPWTPDLLERRVFNLACAGRAICAGASEAETEALADDLLRQARALLAADAGPLRAAERACAAALAGCALEGKAGEALLARALRRLERALPVTVDPDGGHASRSPAAALELFYDLSALDDGLSQRGIAPSPTMARALVDLAGAVRFFTLADGGLAAFQGGAALAGPYIAAARPQDAVGERPVPVALGGYQRLDGGLLQVIADAEAPAAGAWSVAACAQPLAITVLAGGRRLIAGAGWSPDIEGSQALRLGAAASTLDLVEAPCGAVLAGYAAEVLGPRLSAAYATETARRREAHDAIWLDLAQDGWTGPLGLRHDRRLYLDTARGELRGEDQLSPVQGAAGDRRRFVPFVVRFHLAPEVSALISQDKRSVLLRIDGAETGWRLLNDALDVVLEPSICCQDGRTRPSQQIVLRGRARLDSGAKVRWKLAMASGG
jgi:uncharacterized heparinase superfamily protein